MTRLGAGSLRRAPRTPAGTRVVGAVRRLDAYFEADAGHGFREPGFPKGHRLEPQITIGLLTDASGSADPRGVREQPARDPHHGPDDHRRSWRPTGSLRPLWWLMPGWISEANIKAIEAATR